MRTKHRESQKKAWAGFSDTIVNRKQKLLIKSKKTSSKASLFVALGVHLFLTGSLAAKPELQKKEPQKLKEKNTAIKKNSGPLTMAQTIQLVLNNNHEVGIQQLEILKSDTELLKDESQYSPVLETGALYNKTIDQENPFDISQAALGHIQDIRKHYSKVKKLFQSGTYFEVEASDTRIDIHAGDVPPREQIFEAGTSTYQHRSPLHQGALQIVLQQELLKNAFGYNQKRANDINRNIAKIKRENLTYQLTGIVVKAMIQYWNLSIANEQLKTSKVLLNNTRRLKKITHYKRKIGLTEAFELNQWTALLARAQTSVRMAKLNRDTKKRDLLRIMNLATDSRLNGQTRLQNKYPEDIDESKDLVYAYDTRPDFQSLVLQKENVRKSYEISENQLLPSVSLGGKYTSRDYNRKAGAAFSGALQNRYPDYGIEFKVEYPLWNESAKVDMRNARINLRKLNMQELKLRRQIKDEISAGIDQIKANHIAVQNAATALKATQAYFAGLMHRYKQGRFTAMAVKEALDQLVESREGYTISLVNYNIALIRYDLVRNKIFTKYNIDIEKILNRMIDDLE